MEGAELIHQVAPVAPRERPILFSAPMVRAILSGAKTQTRRLIAIPRRGAFVCLDHGDGWWPYASDNGESALCDDGNEYPMACPYGVPGDRLWVRETIRLVSNWHDGERDWSDSVYAADETPTKADAWPWKRHVLPAIHCPRGLSRITLEVTEVRVQRLQDISAADMRAEGVACELDGYSSIGGTHCDCMPCESLRSRFVGLWDRINGKRAPWSTNPWVWCVSFERV